MNKNNQSMRPKNIFGRLTQGILLACLMLGFGFAELQAQTGASFYNSVGGEVTNEVTVEPGDFFTILVGIEIQEGTVADGVTATMLWDNAMLVAQSDQVTDLDDQWSFPLNNQADQEMGMLSFSKFILGGSVGEGNYQYFELEFQVSPDAASGTTELAHELNPAINNASNIVFAGLSVMDDAPALVINIQGPVDCENLGLNIGDACNAGGDEPIDGTVNADCECIADITVPSNDLPCAALPIACGESASGSTVDATEEGNPADFCGTTPDANGVWYSLIGDGSLVTVSLCGSDYDTKLNVYNGTCDALECVTGNDDNSAACGPGNNSQLDFIAEVGVEYFILINGWSGNTGAYALNITCVAFDCPDLAANIGDACDDGDDTTYDDVVGADCGCAGTLYDCVDLLANIGDACDDGDPATINDVVTADCVCLGEIGEVDCLNTSSFGSVTLNNSPNEQIVSTCSFESEYSTFFNVLAGSEYTFSSVGGGGYITLRSGTFDGPIIGEGFSPVAVVAADDSDIFAHWNVDAECNTENNCVVTSVICSSCQFDCPDLDANIGDACDDGDETTYDDVVGTDCLCAGTPYDCLDLLANIGDACDDGDATTVDDVVTADCGCEGTSVIVTVDCDQPVTETYCYGNNEDRVWVYQSEEGSTMNLSFAFGLMEGGFDDIVIYDGDNDAAPILYSSLDVPTSAGAIDLAALVNVNSTGNAILVTLDSDGSVSCASSTTYEGGWEWTVACNGDDCAADGGEISFADGTVEYTVCVDDGEPSMVMLDVIVPASADYATTWVITDADGNLLGLPPTQEAVEGIDFDDAGAGNCLIWVLNFDPENSNVLAAAEAFEAGEDVNAGDLEGCFDLSNAASVIRVNCNDECENWALYMNNNLGGETDVFGVDISSGDAMLTWIATVEYQGHIAFNPENNLIYVINNMNASFVTVDPLTGFVSGSVFLDMDIASITTAAFAPNGKLLMGTMTEDVIYSVDLSPAVPAVTVFDSFAPINGGDIAFDSAGVLYLATRSGNGFYKVYPDDVMADELIGTIPSLVTGMALTDTEQMIMSHKANSDLQLRDLSGAAALETYPLMLDGEAYAHADGDMTSGCFTGIPVIQWCEDFSMFYVDHVVGGSGSVYDVSFTETDANLSLLTTVDFPAHIGYNATDDELYLVNPDGSFIRGYNPTTEVFLGDLPITGLPDVVSLVAVVYNSADGLLYVGDMEEGKLYTIDLGSGAATFFADAPVNGGDLSLQDGTLYLAGRTDNKLYEIAGGVAVEIGLIPVQVNGMAQANSPAPTDLIIANNYASVFTKVNAADASVVATYDVMLDGSSFTCSNGDMAAGCADDADGNGSGFAEENNVLLDAGMSTISSFPNPTNGPSQVVFVTAENGRALLEVFDMNGRNVTTLYNQEAQAGMEYRVDYNGSNLTNGVYIYKLTTNNEVIIDKFMIAR